MKYLVDTSVWSLALRKDGPASHTAVEKLALFLEEHQEVVIIGVILQEILQGFRQEATFVKVASYFDSFPLLDLRRDDFITAAKIRRTATTKGLSLSTPDCQIAAAAIEHQCHLLTTDKDFEHLSRWVPLKLG